MSYLSKEKLLDILQFHKDKYNSELFDECGFEGGWKEAIEQVISDVEDMPEEDVYPVIQSEWKIDKYGRCYCPKCGFISEWRRVTISNDSFQGVGTPFCPFCGVKMKEKDD